MYVPNRSWRARARLWRATWPCERARARARAREREREREREIERERERERDRERERKKERVSSRTVARSRHCCKRGPVRPHEPPLRANAFLLSLTHVCVCVSVRVHTGCPRTAGPACYFPSRQPWGTRSREDFRGSVRHLDGARYANSNLERIESNRENDRSARGHTASNAVDFRLRPSVHGKRAIHRSSNPTNGVAVTLRAVLAERDLWISRKANGQIRRRPFSDTLYTTDGCAVAGTCAPVWVRAPFPSPSRSLLLWIFLLRRCWREHTRATSVRVRAWNRSAATRDVAFCNEPIYLPPLRPLLRHFYPHPLCILHLPSAVFFRLIATSEPLKVSRRAHEWSKVRGGGTRGLSMEGEGMDWEKAADNEVNFREKALSRSQIGWSVALIRFVLQFWRSPIGSFDFR